MTAWWQPGDNLVTTWWQPGDTLSRFILIRNNGYQAVILIVRTLPVTGWQPTSVLILSFPWLPSYYYKDNFIKAKDLQNIDSEGLVFWKKKAASYSPALHCSTIGVSGLNFSVRNGKRWDPTTITTWYGVDMCIDTNYTVKTNTISTNIIAKALATNKVFGQLVMLGFDVTVFTPASYQRRSLRRPSMEI